MARRLPQVLPAQRANVPLARTAFIPTLPAIVFVDLVQQAFTVSLINRSVLFAQMAPHHPLRPLAALHLALCVLQVSILIP
jgi:hypothetical protein